MFTGEPALEWQHEKPSWPTFTLQLQQLPTLYHMYFKVIYLKYSRRLVLKQKGHNFKGSWGNLGRRGLKIKVLGDVAQYVPRFNSIPSAARSKLQAFDKG